MKALLSPNFTQILQIFSFFKCFTASEGIQIPQCLRLMTIDELASNIDHQNFETLLIKQMLVFLLSKTYNKKIEKGTHSVGCSHLLNGKLMPYRDSIIEKYYLPLAVEEYYCLCNPEAQRAQLASKAYFYELDSHFKYQLLSCLVSNARETIRKNANKSEAKPLSKSFSRPQEKENKTLPKKNEVSFSEILLLGEDNVSLYLFAPCLPSYILVHSFKKWSALTKETTLSKIKQILSRPECPNNLQLAENIELIFDKYQTNPSPDVQFRILKNKQASSQEQKVKFLKEQLWVFNDKYGKYHLSYKNHCYAPKSTRAKYAKMVECAKSMPELLGAYLYFYEQTEGQIYRCLLQNENMVDLNAECQAYEIIKKTYANIHYTKISINDKLALFHYELSEKLVSNKSADLYPTFELAVLLLLSGLEKLEEKAAKFQLQKQKQLLKKESNLSLLSQQSSLSHQEKDQKRITRKAKVNRGRVLDSDSESQEESFAKPATKGRNQFSKYQLKNLM